VGSYAIADTALGRDAATLVEFEALRISHGFRPLKFERIASRTRGGPPEGFHVFTFEVMETSLVSVPSNRDAVVTAFSRQKLHSPLVKSWAGGLMAGRPVLVTSGWAKTPKTTTACDGSCSRRIHRRFRRRLRAGRGPGRKTLKSMRTALRTAIGVQATKALLAPAQSGSFSKPACVCSVDLAPGKGRLARGVMASLTTGNVGLGVLDQTRKAIKKALQRDKTFAPPPPRGSAEHRLLCQHEAAHAVLGLLMGVPIKEATVAGTKDTQGHVRLDAAGFAKLSTAEAVALNLAGFAAESWARPDDAPPDLSGQTDRKTARKGLAALSRGPVPKAAVEGLARRLGELFLRIPGVCDATRSVAALLEGSPSGQVAGGRVELAAREAIGDARWAAVGSHLRERAADIVNDVARNHRPRTAA
jgi:hypothetical protein